MVERGPFPGSKNVYGGVVYARVLDEILPQWWLEVPVQRWVTRRSTMIMTGRQALTVDIRAQSWGEAPYNGMTTYRQDFDLWLAGKAVQAGAELVTSTVATGLIRDRRGRVCGVRTDRPGGDLRARVVIACDGVNSFLAKEAGLLPAADAGHHTLGVKEVWSLPPEVIEERYALGPREGLDIEMLGCTRGIPGGGFLYTCQDTVAVGVVVSVRGLARSKVRPEELIADLRGHPSIAPGLRGAELKEYSAHLIPEGGYRTMPKLVTDGLLIAGDAAEMCLAAGLWLEGVNFAIGSGLAAGAATAQAVSAGDVTATGLASYRTSMERSFVLRDHKRMQHAPKLVLSERLHAQYTGLICDLAEGARELATVPPLAALEDAHGAAGLRQAGRGDGAAEPGPDHDDVVALLHSDRSFAPPG
jgi:electron transfer flavoprotein-quinone oxidoreductase